MTTRDKKIYRFLEMIPGLLTWSAFILSFVLSFYIPFAVIVFIIIYDLFWVYRIMYFVFYMIVAWIKYRASLRRNWFADVKKLDNWKRITHAIFLPTYSEPVEVLDQSLEALLKSDYPSETMIVIVGFEERIGKDVYQPKADYLKNKYGNKFKELIITVHPDGLEGEIKAKGANAHWMGQEFKKWVDTQDIPYEDIVVSYFDSDTQVHKKYFSVLTYKYLTHPTPTRTSYQPVALYNNNIWDSPAIMRLTAFSTVFWLLTELMRPERLYTFSSHSMSFVALVDVDFWEKDIVTDDSRIFLQCFIHYNGEYTVTPMFIPVSMDTVLADTHKESYIALYKQVRRWAWSVEHFPYMVWNFFFKKRSIPFWKKIKYLFNLTEGTFSWATAAILIFVLGRLPLWVINTYHQDYTESKSFLVQNAPFILERLMLLSMAGILVSGLVSFLLLPKRPKRYGFGRTITMVLQWLLLPITFILSSIPAIDSQTRLLFGKYLGFFVTPKSRKK